MQIKVNGEIQEFSAGLNVQALVEALKLNATQVAIECNRQIVPKSTYGNVALADGDEIEIVRFVGGG